ncbi:hypothetical protein BN7_6452 [Wickerhamomyces ciferrii]|uniref:Internalin-I n=1 Tax=Wickerhamomyces ciferrii (strain ATCC 14091 / BCRC 22168 / CBS 111 / JCM 3599 / NBRC 0793 / NRRL Y-1031 F-60-10) TaxID=1206466 RepID=K0KUJ9_WICCF|nr:uncharacterized protein BN7_6452 [Wickerhamomyces ciferrii]CCH46851.1 hypothetical protein BN7_6452 [Wickerhamomyces ciferrii]
MKMENDYLQLVLKNLPFELFLKVLDNSSPTDIKKFIEIIPGLHNQIKDRYKIIQWPPLRANPKHEDVIQDLKTVSEDIQCIYQFKGLILLEIKDVESEYSRDLLRNFLPKIEAEMKFKAFKIYITNDDPQWYHANHNGRSFINSLFSVLDKRQDNIFKHCSLTGLKRLHLPNGKFWIPECIKFYDFSQDGSSSNQAVEDVRFMGGLETLRIEGDLRSDVLESKIPLFPQQLILYQPSTTPLLSRQCFQNVTDLRLYDINDDIFGFVELPNLVHLLVTGRNLFKVSDLKAPALESLTIHSDLTGLSFQLFNIETPQIKQLELICETFHSAEFVSFDTLKEVTIDQPIYYTNPPIINLELLANNGNLSNPLNFVKSAKRIRVSNTIPIFTKTHFPNLESFTILGDGYGRRSVENQIYSIPSSVNELIFTSMKYFDELDHLGRSGIKKVQILDRHIDSRYKLDLRTLSILYPDVESLILQNCYLKDLNNQLNNHNIKELDVHFDQVATGRSLNFEGAVFSQLRKLRIRHPQEHPKVHLKNYLNLKGFEAPNLEELIVQDFHIEHHLSTSPYPKLKKLTIDYASSLEIVSSDILEEVHLDGGNNYGFLACIKQLYMGEIFRNSGFKFYPPKPIVKESWMNV